MKKPPDSHLPKYNLSFKRWLVDRNRELNLILYKVQFVSYDDIFYDHSHLSRQAELSNFLIATLALEDRGFFSHCGFEPIKMIARTIRRFFSGRRLGGISTIDQQVVRICRNRYERTFSRKFSETILAISLNSHVSKSDILQFYIHNSYFGHSLEGCEIAANRIFGRPASLLNLDEACILAAALARPIPKSVVNGMKKIKPVDRNSEVFMEITRNAHPKYAQILARRADYARELVLGKFKRRFIKNA